MAHPPLQAVGAASLPPRVLFRCQGRINGPPGRSRAGGGFNCCSGWMKELWGFIAPVNSGGSNSSGCASPGAAPGQIPRRPETPRVHLGRRQEDTGVGGGLMSVGLGNPVGLEAAAPGALPTHPAVHGPGIAPRKAFGKSPGDFSLRRLVQVTATAGSPLGAPAPGGGGASVAHGSQSIVPSGSRP